VRYTEVTRFEVFGFLESFMDTRNTPLDRDQTVCINTTIGDLIEAITDIALQAGKSEEEGYRLASFTIEKLLREKRRKDIMEA